MYGVDTLAARRDSVGQTTPIDRHPEDSPMSRPVIGNRSAALLHEGLPDRLASIPLGPAAAVKFGRSVWSAKCRQGRHRPALLKSPRIVVCMVLANKMDDEAIAAHGRTEHWNFEGVPSRTRLEGFIPQAGCQRYDLLQVACPLWRHGNVGCGKAKGVGTIGK